MTMIAPRLTDEQKAMFKALGLDDFANLALVSTVEKATGKHRALVMSMSIDEDDNSVEMFPVAMLLDGDDDIELFEPPSTDVEEK